MEYSRPESMTRALTQVLIGACARKRAMNDFYGSYWTAPGQRSACSRLAIRLGLRTLFALRCGLLLGSPPGTHSLRCGLALRGTEMALLPSRFGSRSRS